MYHSNVLDVFTSAKVQARKVGWNNKYMTLTRDQRWNSDVEGYLFFVNRTAVKVYFHIPRDLATPDEVNKLYILSDYMLPNSNKLMYTGHGNIKHPMRLRHIAKALGLAHLTATRFVDKMVERRLMAADKEGSYYLNPLYFFAGRWLTRTCYFLFKQDLDPHIPTWAIRAYCDEDDEPTEAEPNSGTDRTEPEPTQAGKHAGTRTQQAAKEGKAQG